MIPKYYYCMLPSGNQSQFPQIELRLKRLKIGASYASTWYYGGMFGSSEARIYRIPAENVKRLPISHDYDGDYGVCHYLPTDDASGHSVWPWSHSTISLSRINFRMGSWISL